MTVETSLSLWSEDGIVWGNRHTPDGDKWIVPGTMEIADSFETCRYSGCAPCEHSVVAGCQFVESVNGTPTFFPVDGIEGALTDDAFPAQIYPPYVTSDKLEGQLGGTEATPHNFHFTTELTYWLPFEESANTVLSFVGDDDAWIFLNGKLALDLGGLHHPRGATLTLDAAAKTTFELTEGELMQFKLFHAERQTSGSSFRLELTNVPDSRSFCTPK